MATKANPIPEGFSTLTPHLCCADAAGAIEFYMNAFGAKEVMRFAGPDGKLMHADLTIGSSHLMLFDEMPQWGAFGPLTLKGSPVTIHLAVDDVDAVFARAVAAGAKVKMPVDDMFWGDRYGKVVDPFGHEWSIATQIKVMTTDEVIAAGREAMKQMADCQPPACQDT